MSFRSVCSCLCLRISAISRLEILLCVKSSTPFQKHFVFSTPSDFTYPSSLRSTCRKISRLEISLRSLLSFTTLRSCSLRTRLPDFVRPKFRCLGFSSTPSSHSLCFAMRKTPAHYFGATSGSFALENALHFAILNFLCARCGRSQHFVRVHYALAYRILSVRNFASLIFFHAFK